MRRVLCSNLSNSGNPEVLRVGYSIHFFVQASLVVDEDVVPYAELLSLDFEVVSREFSFDLLHYRSATHFGSYYTFVLLANP